MSVINTEPFTLDPRCLVRRRDEPDVGDRYMNHASAIKRQELRLRVVSAGGKHVFRSAVMGAILWMLHRM